MLVSPSHAISSSANINAKILFSFIKFSNYDLIEFIYWFWFVWFSFILFFSQTNSKRDESNVQSLRWASGRIPLWCIHMWRMQGEFFYFFILFISVVVHFNFQFVEKYAFNKQQKDHFTLFVFRILKDWFNFEVCCNASNCIHYVLKRLLIVHNIQFRSDQIL